MQDVGTFEDGAPFMVMEYLEGSDLNQVLRQYGPQAPAFVCDLMLQACEGIAEAHGLGIVHRDIKPSNFFLTRRPDGSWLLKILDFGISKAPVGYDDLTGTQTVIGTPTYMAPEQMKNGRSADPRSDIWSLGVVMYQLLNGRPPFSGESYADLILKVGTEPPSPMHVTLPNGLGEIIWRCLEKAPAHRFQDVSELARSIAPYASDPQMGAVGASRASRILMATRQSRIGVADQRAVGGAAVSGGVVELAVSDGDVELAVSDGVEPSVAELAAVVAGGEARCPDGDEGGEARPGDEPWLPARRRKARARGDGERRGVPGVAADGQARLRACGGAAARGRAGTDSGAGRRATTACARAASRRHRLGERCGRRGATAADAAREARSARATAGAAAAAAGREGEARRRP